MIGPLWLAEALGVPRSWMVQEDEERDQNGRWSSGGGSSAATKEPPADARIGSAKTNYDTSLSNEEEAQFQTWKERYAPNDSGEDYDFRGAFLAGVTPDRQNGHWPDTFKKPNHPTFSNESQYATGENAARAGHWEDERYVRPLAPKPKGSQADK